MALYLYTNERKGQTIERIFPMTGRIPRKIKHRGSSFVRDIPAEHSGRKDTPGTYPFWSSAAGVAESQISETTAYLARKGISVDFNKDGDIQMRSRRHRCAVLKALELVDKNGGYSDP